MSTQTVRVTGAITMSNGQPFASTQFKFELTKAGVDPSSNTVIPATPITTLSNSSGNIWIDLWPNDRGFGNTLYKVTAVIGGRDVHLGEIQVLQAGSKEIGALLSNMDYKRIDAELVALENALRAEAAATAAKGHKDEVDPAQIEARAVATSKASAPKAPNVMKDTRYFAGLCKGEVGVEYDVTDDGVFDGPWAMRIDAGVTATLKVVELDDPEIAAITVQQGEIAELLGNDASRLYAHALIMDVTITSDVEDALFDLRQPFGSPSPTQYGGQGLLQGHAGVAVLSQTGDTHLKLFSNWADAYVEGDRLGAGWGRAYGASGSGTRWAEIRNYVIGKGSMRVAILLPYASSGDHGDIAIWAPNDGSNPYADT